MKTNQVRKVLVYALLFLLLFCGGGYAAYRGYVYARQVRLLKQTRQYLAKPDLKKALLFLQRALHYDPKDVEACRLMAELTQDAQSPSTLLWRSKVVELDPGSVDDRLALARTALMQRDFATATNALQGVSAAGKKTCAYHIVAGTIAASANLPAQAEAHFLEAARLEPRNQVPQLNLAIVRLDSTNSAVQVEARTTLDHLRSSATNSNLRCQALRVLVLDALRTKRPQVALSFSGQLLQQTNVVFSDRLLRLDVLKESSKAQFDPALVELQHDAAGDPGRIYELATWQMVKTSPAETLRWLRSLPPATQTNQTVALKLAECYTTVEDWNGLTKFLRPQYWGELEFLRHAFNARALRGQGLADAAGAEWELAVKVANQQKSSLVMLLRLADAWKWQSEGEELLWNFLSWYPDEQWAFEALNRLFYISGRTQSLMRLYTQEVKRAPSLPMKNNLAMTALLLDARELKPDELAREVYQAAPTNGAYASTYAFSLYLKGKYADALKIFQTLQPKDLENPSTAGYYGLVLKATGDKAKARVYLDWAFKGTLLPEERKLFERAKSGT